MAKKPRKTERASEPPPQSPSTPAPPPTAVAAQKPKRSIFRNVDARKAVQIVVITSLYSHASQAALSPVYGSVPAGLYHRYGLTASVLLAVFLRGSVRLVPQQIARVIPTFAFWIPTIHFLLFKFSSTLGNPYGPLITECLTYYPLIFSSMYVAVAYFDKVDLSSFDPLVAEFGPSLGLFVFFNTLQRTTKAFFTRNIGSNFIMSRIGLQLVLASLYSVALPNNFFWSSLPSAAFTMLGNVHNPLMRTTEVLNNTLALYDYKLLERAESITGYISVLESNRDQFRVMRCDHSLLGGEWTMPPPAGRHPLVKEPIYAIFTMLEAVRLVETEDQKQSSDSEKKLLNIGVGIGTAPTAMMAHGINTTIIELDPYVYLFAMKYFDLPTDHLYSIGDAVWIVESWSRMHPRPTYDYVIHDVFTGGAEPAELFTLEFLTDLATLLKPDGVIAINYAGDLSMPATLLVYRTIKAVFPSCRAFRESETPLANTDGTDFTNMVIFCKKSSSPLRFRKPLQADYLGSGAREEFLLPKFEIPAEKFSLEGGLLKRGYENDLRKSQAQSAVGHWRVMRTVLPDGVWENW